MQDRALYSIQEARKLLGGISRNTIYRLLRTGELASVVIGCRRCIPAAAIEEFIQASTTRVSRSLAGVREPRPRRQLVAPPIRARASPRAAERGHFAILPSPPSPPSNQKR
jgi:excisionase family DNA binding protein